MKITLPATQQTSAKNYNQQKELVKRMVLVAYNPEALHKDDKFKEIIDARFYMSYKADGAAPLYCSVWVHSQNFYISGTGRASGYGYHKPSAALEDALHSCGVRTDSTIGGVGESAMRDVLTGIAEALGHKNFHIVE